MNKFVDRDWDFKVPASCIIESLRHECSELQERLKSVGEQARTLETSNNTLQGHVSYLSAKQRKEAEGHGSTRGKRRQSLEYSDRHVQRLKRQRTQSCAASLSWLELEGLKPLSVVVENKETKKTETIVMNQ